MGRQLEFWEQAGDGDDGSSPAPVVEPRLVGAEKKGEKADRAGNDDTVAAETLRGEMCRLSGMSVFLKITDNAHSLLRVVHEPGGGRARLSVHWMFLDAPKAVVQALAGWVKTPRSLRKNSLLRGYMRENAHRITASEERRVTLRSTGIHYDLTELYDEVNTAEFGGAVDAQITWGVMPPVGRGRSGHFRLGSYTEGKKLIRIHPVLDRPEVPRYVVRSIVFHEMLHAFLGIKQEDGKRRKIHHAAFRERERLYRDHLAAEAWINDAKNMRLLSRLRRLGKLSAPGQERNP